jgi:hypothetical protein
MATVGIYFVHCNRFSVLRDVLTGSGTHPVSHSEGNRRPSFPGSKEAES